MIFVVLSHANYSMPSDLSSLLKFPWKHLYQCPLKVDSISITSPFSLSESNLRWAMSALALNNQSPNPVHRSLLFSCIGFVKVWYFLVISDRCEFMKTDIYEKLSYHVCTSPKYLQGSFLLCWITTTTTKYFLNFQRCHDLKLYSKITHKASLWHKGRDVEGKQKC